MAARSYVRSSDIEGPKEARHLGATDLGVDGGFSILSMACRGQRSLKGEKRNVVFSSKRESIARDATG
jgi:hypothetical protein